MKTTQMTIIALFMMASMAIQAQQAVEKPASMHSNTTSVEIHRVTLSDDATVLDMDAFYRPGWWIKITSESYLMAEGKKYMIRSGEGIELDSLFWMPASGEASFKLLFEPLPKNTKTFDFIEGDCENCFKIWGVDLVNDRIVLPKIPGEFREAAKADADIAVKWESGKAVVSGQLLGYSPQYGVNVQLGYMNPVTMKEKMVPVTPEADGTFRAEIEMCSPGHLGLVYGSPQSDYCEFIAAPGKETKIIVNLPEINRQKSRLHKESPEYGKKVMFAGYQAKLNDELYYGDLTKSIYSQNLMNDILDMSLTEYTNYIMEKYRKSVADNNARNISQLAKKIVNMQLGFEVNDLLMSANYFLTQAYMQKHNVSYPEASKAVGPFQIPEDSHDYLVEIPYPYNDLDVLLVHNMPYKVNGLGYLSNPKGDKFGLFRYMAASEKLKPEERKIMSNYLEKIKDEEVTPDSLVISVLKSYTGLQQEYFDGTRGPNYLSKVWNMDDCLLFDLMAAYKISRKMEDFYPLTDDQKKAIEVFDPVMRDVLLEENRALLARIEENKKKTGYTVLDVPEVTDEELFAEMIKPFKGKVVVVDVWETWCGPCRMANKAMEPLKAQLADKEMIYLYLASNSSPENTWNNMIPDLHGYHYRVNDKQSAFLRWQLRSGGVPTYIVLDKEGNETFHAVGFPGADTMKKELMKALGE